MDPLTHSLVGASLARTRLGRGTRLAGAALVLAANAADIDVFSHVAGSDAALGFRRGWTHGPLALLVLPPLSTALLVAWARLRPPADGAPPLVPHRLLGLSYLAFLTHPLLDLLNTYGIRLLMPFDDRWFYGDSLFIVDPWLWLLLGGTAFVGTRRRGRPWGWIVLAALAFLVLLAGRAWVPRGAVALWVVGLALIVALHGLVRDRPAPRRAVAALGLLLAGGYIAALVSLSLAGESWVRGELARRGIAGVQRLMIGPMPANPLHWDVLAETADAYRHGSLRWRPRPELTLAPKPIARPAPSPVVQAARAAGGIHRTLDWMRFPFVEVEETPGGYVVRWIDARYSRLPQPKRDGFGRASVRLDRDLHPIAD